MNGLWSISQDMITLQEYVVEWFERSEAVEWLERFELTTRSDGQ